MENSKLKSLNNLNKNIIRYRNIYSSWSISKGISYHEMLVYYTIREYGYCSQKMICDSYLLPKQTINNVFIKLLKEDILEKNKTNGREILFTLTKKGKDKYNAFIKELDKAESYAVDMIGIDKLDLLEDIIAQYNKALTKAFEGTNNDKR